MIVTWEGELVAEDAEKLLVHAQWSYAKPRLLGYTVFETGDPFIEAYYRGRWFSIWQVLNHRNRRVKGWYCNVCRPIELTAEGLSFIDMELDAFVYPDGRYCVLDEEDLEQAPISAEDKALARRGLDDVLDWIVQRRPPFDIIGPPRRVQPFWDLS
ncbi:MAG TPA: DUF402 domain-containing protein [Chloroflexota bacterium]|nr:DUF402 domain-containing protein [Chloroflexota bacterium]